MATVELFAENASVVLECRSLRGAERLGEPVELEIEAFSKTPVEASAVLAKLMRVRVESGPGARILTGVVMRFGAVATSSATAGRRYRLTLRSRLGVLALRKRSAVYQTISVPDLVKQLVTDMGYSGDTLRVGTQEKHAPREYVVQYAETDLAFVRRLCEEEGLYFRFEDQGGLDAFVLEDTSAAAEKVLGAPLPVLDESHLARGVACARRCRASLRRRPGKVTLRDYNPSSPSLALEGVKQAGTDVEKEVEVYEAPGRFADPAGGDARAKHRLESLRADGSVLRFETTAIGLSPGVAVTLEPTADYTGAARAEGDFLVVACLHDWTPERGEYAIQIESIPLAVPFRLARVTPRPHVPGLHSAFVTTPPGAEIQVEKDGRARVHFHWDREGPTDDKSSLPIRVMQPNTPGSMLLPRGGWEVMVAFEDGDPDRPYILGRVYSAKTPPPYSLPTNKTLTTISTSSSPGAAKRNIINIDDGAGRQNFSILAGFGKSTSVASNMVTQTVKNEDFTVKASQVRTVGVTEAVSVTQAYLNTLGSQSATVGGMQKVFVKGDFTVDVGSESVLVGAACLEKVGNQVAALKNLGKAAALQVAGAVGVPIDAISKGVALADAGVRGDQQGGFAGAAAAVGGAAAGMGTSAVAGMVPGGALLLGAAGGGGIAPWVERRLGGGPRATGGGASSGSDAAGAQGPGPGHRNTIVTGSYMELIGGSCSATSPGTIGWTTIGPSTLLIGASHSTKAGQSGTRVLGLSTETLGSLSIKTAGDLNRGIKGLLNTTIAGSLKSTAGGNRSIKAGGAVSFKVDGSLKMTGSHVSFVCGGSKVSSSSGGVLIESSSIKINGATKQAKVTHRP
jgi:type VI secretion system secreted protein VgrG